MAMVSYVLQLAALQRCDDGQQCVAARDATMMRQWLVMRYNDGQQRSVEKQFFKFFYSTVSRPPLHVSLCKKERKKARKRKRRGEEV